MNKSIYIIILVVLLSFAVYKIIKKTCYPIKTITAILLVVPTVVTCGIAIFVYKMLRGSFTGMNYSSSSTNNTNTNFDIEPEVSKKEEKKKVGRSFTDSFGKTMYYDKEGNLMGSSIDNGFGKKKFTDNEGNYAGESLDNNLGATMYTDKDGNTITSNTNYLGEETFPDGTTTKTDSSGNKYYS